MTLQTSDLRQHFIQQQSNVKNILIEFTKSIHLNIFSRNRESLLLDAAIVKFQKDSWKMRPDIFCLEYYKEPYFHPVVLLANNLGSVFSFQPENLINGVIIAPTKTKIIKLLNYA